MKFWSIPQTNQTSRFLPDVVNDSWCKGFKKQLDNFFLMQTIETSSYCYLHVKKLRWKFMQLVNIPMHKKIQIHTSCEYSLDKKFHWYCLRAGIVRMNVRATHHQDSRYRNAWCRGEYTAMLIIMIIRIIIVDQDDIAVPMTARRTEPWLANRSAN